MIKFTQNKMKFLTIIRHAKSDWKDPDLDDIARPLNERGRGAVLLVGNYLYQQKMKPDLIITSPATRAHDTATGIAELVKYDVKKLQTEPVVYFGTSSAIIDMLHGIDNQYEDIFLFGHEPILSSLIFQLTKNQLEKFSTCAVFRISFDIKDWNEIGTKKGKCEFFVNPKQLLEK